MAGLLNDAGVAGIGEGIKNGLITGMTLANARQQQQMAMAINGLEKDENGNIVPNARRRKEMELEAAKTDTALGMIDPNSEASKRLATKRGVLAHAGNPGLPADLFQGASAAEQKELEGLTKPDITGQYGLLGRQVSANMMGQRLGQSNDRLQMSANKDYSHEMGQTENQLLAANRVNALVKGIKAGQLQSTPQLKSDLSAALAQMLNNGKPATVYGMSHQEFDSAFGRAQRAYQFLSGDTGDSMTEPQLMQLQKDVNALQHEYQKQREVKYNAFKKGMPIRVTGGLDQRYQSFGAGANEGLIGNEPPSGGTGPGGVMGFEEFMKSRQGKK